MSKRALKEGKSQCNAWLDCLQITQTTNLMQNSSQRRSQRRNRGAGVKRYGVEDYSGKEFSGQQYAKSKKRITEEDYEDAHAYLDKVITDWDSWMQEREEAEDSEIISVARPPKGFKVSGKPKTSLEQEMDWLDFAYKKEQKYQDSLPWTHLEKAPREFMLIDCSDFYASMNEFTTVINLLTRKKFKSVWQNTKGFHKQIGFTQGDDRKYCVLYEVTPEPMKYDIDPRFFEEQSPRSSQMQVIRTLRKLDDKVKERKMIVIQDKLKKEYMEGGRTEGEAQKLAEKEANEYAYTGLDPLAWTMASGPIEHGQAAYTFGNEEQKLKESKGFHILSSQVKFDLDGNQLANPEHILHFHDTVPLAPGNDEFEFLFKLFMRYYEQFYPRTEEQKQMCKVYVSAIGGVMGGKIMQAIHRDTNYLAPGIADELFEKYGCLPASMLIPLQIKHRKTNQGIRTVLKFRYGEQVEFETKAPGGLIFSGAATHAGGVHEGDLDVSGDEYVFVRLHVHFDVDYFPRLSDSVELEGQNLMSITRPNTKKTALIKKLTDKQKQRQKAEEAERATLGDSNVIKQERGSVRSGGESSVGGGSYTIMTETEWERFVQTVEDERNAAVVAYEFRKNYASAVGQSGVRLTESFWREPLIKSYSYHWYLGRNPFPAKEATDTAKGTLELKGVEKPGKKSTSVFSLKRKAPPM